jgi:hypothetical protein
MAARDSLQRILEGQVNAFVTMALTEDVTIPAGTVWMQRNISIADGVNLTIQDGAELLIE